MSFNPFQYGSPVPTDQHVDRRVEIRTLFSRLINNESSAIVGEPHIGKSSLLHYLADEDVRHEWLGKMSDQQMCIEFDCEMLAASFTPNDFWQLVLLRISEITDSDELKQQCAIVAQNNFGSFSLEGLFKLLAKKERHVILLLDEFDTLLNHPNFNKAEFFGALRSFATRTDGLAIVTASRLSVGQMNRKSQELNPFGSPFFNNSIEIRLLPFTREDAQHLIEAALARGDSTIRFSYTDYDWLFSLAGRQPFLVQVAGASLYDAIANGDAGDARYANATALFHQRTAAHFADFWRHLTDNEKRALFLLALAEYRGYTDGRTFNMLQLGKLDRYTPELRHLRELGIVESDRSSYMVSWGGENWHVASVALITWLMDNVTTSLRNTGDFEAIKQWEFLGPLTRDEIAKIKEIASKVPPETISTAAEFIKSLFRV